ncbi:MAG: ABC transporter permease [Variibacter sp.]|nr:ABC transporter permease [Variibacter sp.]
MLRYLLNRLAQSVIVLIGASLVIFVLIRVIPGDPVDVMFADIEMTPEQRALFAQEYGLDRSWGEQYLIYLGKLLMGDFGESVRQQVPVLELVLEALPNTVELTIASILVALLIGVPVAIVSALRQGTIWDRGGMLATLFGMSMPTFWQALLLMMLLSVMWPILPVSGVLDPGMEVRPITAFTSVDAILRQDWEALGSFFLHLILPAVVLGTHVCAVIARLLRTGMIEVKNQDFVVALKARGLGAAAVLRHMLRNALPTTVIVLGLRIGSLLGGTLVVETVFSWPGLGWLLISGIAARDYPLIQGVVVVTTLLVVVTNLLADLLQAWLDPRISLR